MSYITNREWITEVMFGNVPKHSGRVINGSASIGTAQQPIWGVTDSILDNLTLLGTPSTVKVASTSANDTSAGTGARTVRVNGLDASGVEASEDITLNGQTEVTSVATFSAINSLVSLTAGSTGWNEGVIWCGNGTFTAGVPATKYRMMEISRNNDSTFLYVVPVGKTAYPYQIETSVGESNKPVNLFLYQELFGGLRYIIDELELSGGTASSRSYLATGFPQATMMWAEAATGAGTVIIGISVILILKDN